MVPGPPHLRLLLVLHGVLGATVTALATHHVVWAVRLVRGRRGLRRAERRFVALLAMAYVAQFALGNVLYPSYRRQVRAGYLEAPAVQQAEAAVRAAGRREAEGTSQDWLRAGNARWGEAHRGSATTRGGGNAPPSIVEPLGWVAHLFDVKEHATALGLGPLAALLVLSLAVDPTERREVAPLYLGLSIAVAVCVWTALLVGFYVTSVRAIA